MREITKERVLAEMELRGCGMMEARAYLTQADIAEAIATARTIDDLRLCMSALLTLVWRR